MSSSKNKDISETGKYLEDDSRPSKSEKKREVLALRECAEFICHLKSEQQSQLPLSISITNALLEYKRLKNKNAQQRHIQFLTKILIDTDNLPEIEKAIERFQHPHLHQQKIDRAVDNSFENIMSSNTEKSQHEIDAVLIQNPSLDRQTFTQLIRNAQKENKETLSEINQKSQKGDKKQQQKLKKMLRNHFNYLETSPSQP